MKIQRLIRARHPATLLLLLLPACSSPPPWDGSVESRDGMEIVRNPGIPFLQEAQGPLPELWSFQGSHWMDPTRVHAQSGLITVVDPPANQVHLLSTAGEARPSVGRPGGGPGEFLRLLDALPQGNRLLILDGGRSSIEYLSPEGDYLSSMHVQGQAWDGFLLESGELLVKGEFLADPGAESFGDWVRVGEGSDPTAFTSLALDPLPQEEGVQCSDLSAWAGGAARMRFTTPQIQLFDESGSIQGEIHVNLAIEPVSEEEREAALSELERSLASRGMPPAYAQQSLIVMEERWRVKCRFGPLRFDPTRRLAAFLEQNPDTFGSGNATLHFLSEDGVYLAKTSFPEPWRDFTMEDGVVYALTRNAVTDLMTLRAYQLELPQDLLSQATAVLGEARRLGQGPG